MPDFLWLYNVQIDFSTKKTWFLSKHIRKRHITDNKNGAPKSNRIHIITRITINNNNSNNNKTNHMYIYIYIHVCLSAFSPLTWSSHVRRIIGKLACHPTGQEVPEEWPAGAGIFSGGAFQASQARGSSSYMTYYSLFINE